MLLREARNHQTITYPLFEGDFADVEPDAVFQGRGVPLPLKHHEAPGLDGQITFSDGAQLDLAHEIAQQCGADQVVSLLHSKQAEPVLVEAYNTSATLFTMPRIAELAKSAAWCLHRLHNRPDSAHVEADDTSVTAAFCVGQTRATITCGLTGAAADRVQECAARLRKLLPFIRACYSHWVHAARADARSRALGSAVDHASIAILLLDRNRTIIHANPAAEALLARGDGVRRSAGGLACPQLSDTLRMNAALEHLGGERRDAADAGPVIALPRKGRRPLLAAFVAVEQAPQQLPDEAEVIAYIFDPEEDLGSIVEPCCQIYALSPQECKLTCALVGGATLAEAAEQLGLQEQTARSYLKNIFFKTETHRQAELVQLMLKCAIRVVSAQRKRAYR